MRERIGGVTLSRRRLLSLSAAGLVAAALPGAPRANAQVAEGVRTAAYTTGGTNRAFPRYRLRNGSINVRHVIPLPVGTRRWRLRIANYQCRDEVPVEGQVRLTSAWIGEHAPEPDGSWTGRFVAGTQAKVAGPVYLPKGGGQLTTAWVEEPARQFAADKDRVLSLGVACSTTQTLAASPNKSFQNDAKGEGASKAGVASPGLAKRSDSPLSVVVEYEFGGAGPVGLFLGDSITDGCYTDQGVATDYANRFALANGVPSVVHALGGGTAADFASTRPGGSWGYKWRRLPLAAIKPDFAVISLGTNDLGGANRGVEETEADLLTVARRVASFGTRRIFFGRVTPRRDPEYPSRWTAQDEANRRALNGWMSDPGNGHAGAVYLDEALMDPGDPTLLAPEYDGGDRLHPNTKGHSRMSEEAARVVLA